MPPERLDPGHLGHRPRAQPERPSPRGGRPSAATRSRRSGPWQPGLARWHGAPGAPKLPSVPGQHRNRPGARHSAIAAASRTAPSSSSSRRSSRSRSSSSAVHRLGARLAGPRPARCHRPGHRHRAWRPARGGRSYRRARCGGRTDQGRGRERLLALTGSPWQDRRDVLGTQGRHAQEGRPAYPPPGRRDFRRTGRPGGPQVVQQAGAWGPAGRADVQARGVLLLGPPGIGQIAFAKALGNATGRPTLVIDVGALMGSLVGQTEANIRQALRIADAMAPSSSLSTRSRRAWPGANPAGKPTAAWCPALRDLLDLAHGPRVGRLRGSHVERHLETAPGIRAGPSADGVFSSTFPGSGRRKRSGRCSREVWPGPQPGRPNAGIGRGPNQVMLPTGGIARRPLGRGRENIVPVAVTAGESVEKLRNWASGRCLSADRPGPYSREGNGMSRSGRSVHRGDPDTN